MSGLLQRLKERKLVQWALAYLAGAWVLLQVFGLIGQQFDWPQGLLRGVTVAAGVGFFVTLVLAWYHGERGEQRVSGTELLLVALLLIIGGGLLWRFAPHPVDSGSQPKAQSAKPAVVSPPVASDKSIAVLPFANLSDDKANAFFADGMQDEILTKLSKIGALRVISRTSTQRYASAPENLAEIARQLGVANILEGSVQKSGNAVHINVQLIGAAKDEHLWAESYNRTLEDIFGVEGEVAQAVADALKATLTGAERQVVASKGTENPAAYEAYLRGRSMDNASYSFLGTQKAVDNYLVAVHEDPKFARAWAALAVTMANLYFNGYDSARSTDQAVREAADTAMRLQPELAETLWARGGYLYWVRRDFPAALKQFKAALDKQPGDLDMLSSLFFIERRMGRWEDAVAHYREALARDPRNVSLRVQGACEILYWLRRYDETRAQLEEALKIAPDDTTARACLALVEQRVGRLDAADTWLARVPKDTGDYYEGLVHIDQARYRRDLAALGALVEPPALRRTDAELTNVDYIGLIRLGYAQRQSGHPDLARATFERLKRAVAAQPAGIGHVVAVGPLTPLIDAGLGDYERAISAAQEQIRTPDVLELATSTTVLAQVLALAGDRDAAIALLPKLLEMPAGITPALLTLDPMWDPLRDDPRFIALARQPLAVYKAPPHE
ncbi:MAG TPA: tetratricopeptide repeat protein [Rhodanobacteraceae bacterium]|jgi:TolB-like protein/Tfp pilus assembly protein PilF|nr:tetratricopeptide repeat protein [Rhodanobacteraceae bacterium]